MAKGYEDLAFNLILHNDRESRKMALDIFHDDILKPVLVPTDEILTYIEATAILVSGMTSPPERCLKTAVQWLQHEHPDWQLAVSRFFFNLEQPWPSEIAQSLISWLLHEDPLIKEYKVLILNPQTVDLSQLYAAMGVRQKGESISSHLRVAAHAGIVLRAPEISQSIVEERKECHGIVFPEVKRERPL